MKWGMALFLCVATAACLEAPPRGEPGAPAEPGDPAPGGGPDAGDMAPATCDGEGEVADVVFVSRMEVPRGQSNLNQQGFLLLVNTGDDLLDTSQLEVVGALASDPRVAVSVVVDDASGLVASDAATGRWGFSETLLEGKVDEPWVDTGRPSVNVALGYNIPEDLTFTVSMVVKLGGRTAVAPIDVTVGSIIADAVASRRLPLTCPAE